MHMWNPWHGCHKISEGCRHCYVYREDAAFGTATPSNIVRKTSSFLMPLKLDRKKNWKYPSGTTFGLCFTSDMLIEEADGWRDDIWNIIRQRSDCSFVFFTKRIDRLNKCLPADWGDGYDNVAIGCTAENQQRADLRLPIFLDMPIKHRLIIVAPMIGRIDLRKYLDPRLIEEVSAGENQGNMPGLSILNGSKNCNSNVPTARSHLHFIRQARTLSKTANCIISHANTSIHKQKKQD